MLVVVGRAGRRHGAVLADRHHEADVTRAHVGRHVARVGSARGIVGDPREGRELTHRAAGAGEHPDAHRGAGAAHVAAPAREVPLVRGASLRRRRREPAEAGLVQGDAGGSAGSEGTDPARRAVEDRDGRTRDRDAADGREARNRAAVLDAQLGANEGAGAAGRTADAELVDAAIAVVVAAVADLGGRHAGRRTAVVDDAVAVVVDRVRADLRCRKDLIDARAETSARAGLDAVAAGTDAPRDREAGVAARRDAIVTRAVAVVVDVVAGLGDRHAHRDACEVEAVAVLVDTVAARLGRTRVAQ